MNSNENDKHTGKSKPNPTIKSGNLKGIKIEIKYQPIMKKCNLKYSKVLIFEGRCKKMLTGFSL